MALQVEIAKAFVKLEADMKGLKDRLDSIEKDGQSRMQKMGQAWGESLGKFIVQGLAAAGIGASVASIIDKSVQIAQARGRLAFQLGGATGDVNKAMAEFRSISMETGQALREIEAAFLRAQRGGLAYAESLQIVSKAAILARGTNESLSGIVGGAKNVFMLFRDELGSLDTFMNQLAVSTRYLEEGLVPMLDALTLIGPTAKNLGLNVTTLIAILAELQNAGLGGTRAATGLLSVLTSLEQLKFKQTENFTAILDRLGSTAKVAFERFRTGQITALEFLKELDKAGIRAEELDLLFGNMGVRISTVLVSAMKDAKSSLNQVTDALKEVTGALQEMQKATEPRGFERIKRFFGGILDAVSDFAADFFEYLFRPDFYSRMGLREKASLAPEPLGPPKPVTPTPKPAMPAPSIPRTALPRSPELVGQPRYNVPSKAEVAKAEIEAMRQKQEEEKKRREEIEQFIFEVEMERVKRVSEFNAKMQEEEERRRAETVEFIKQLEEERVQRVHEFEWKKLQEEQAALERFYHTIDSTSASLVAFLGPLKYFAKPLEKSIAESLDNTSRIISTVFNISLEDAGNVVSGFVDILIALLERSRGFKSLMEALEPIIQAVADLLGLILEPIAELIRLLTGASEDAQQMSSAMAEAAVNVPTGLKMERLRFEATTPGELPLAGEAGGGAPKRTGLLGALDAFIEGMRGFLSELTRFISPVFEGLAALLGMVAPVIEKFWNALTKVAGWIADVLAPVFEVLGILAQMVLIPVFTALGAVIDGIVWVLENTLGKSLKFLADMVNILAQGIKAVINFIIDIINGILSLFNDIPLVPDIPLIPKLQEGGVVKETGLAEVHKGEVVLPANRAAGTVIYWNGDIVLEGEDAEALLDIIKRYNMRKRGVAFSGALLTT